MARRLAGLLNESARLALEIHALKEQVGAIERVPVENESAPGEGESARDSDGTGSESGSADALSAISPGQVHNPS